MIRGRADPVTAAEQILASAGTELTGFDDLLEEIIRRKLWEARKVQDGSGLSSFAHLAVAARQIGGLAVWSERKMRIVRRTLLDIGLIAEATDLIERTMRHRGRPLKNGNNSAKFHRFWTVPRSMTSTDRILITLKRDHPEEFKEVCAGKCGIAEAAKRVGLVPKVLPRGRWGLSDIAAAVRLNPRAQGDVLCALFEALPMDAQCALLSRVIEPRLGPNLAQRWREGGEQKGRSS